MPHTRVWLVMLALCLPATAWAGKAEDALMKLDPEFRAHQACIGRGLDVVHGDPALRGAVHIKTSILSPAVVTQTRLTAAGGAVKVNNHWFAMSFSCDLTPDRMKATSFTYKLGPAIPEREWERLGLWR